MAYTVEVDEVGTDRLAAALPAYEIGTEIGRGAYGVVIAARHRQLGRPVAIKQLAGAFGAHRAVRSRFVAEARVLAALDHPHIVDIYDFVDYEGVCMLVMERLTGGTVWSRFETGGFSPDVSCALLLAVCAGLHHAHQQGVLHRDIKPENLMFSADGTLKVTDLGIAKVVGGSSTLASRVGEVLGTPAYISPEQARGTELSPATDVYQAGTVLFELLSGRLPFPADSDPATILYRHVHHAPPPLLEVAPHVPPPLAAVVDRAIATSPADRYETAEAFGVAIATGAASAWGGGWLARTGVPISPSGRVLTAAVDERSPLEHSSHDTIVEARATVVARPSTPPAPQPPHEPDRTIPERAPRARTSRVRMLAVVVLLALALLGAGAVIVGATHTGSRKMQPPPPGTDRNAASATGALPGASGPAAAGGNGMPAAPGAGAPAGGPLLAPPVTRKGSTSTTNAPATTSSTSSTSTSTSTSSSTSSTTTTPPQTTK